MRKLLLICLVLFFVTDLNAQSSKSLSEQPVQITKYAVDETGTLTKSEIDALLQKLVNFDKTTSNQLVIYIIPTINDESLEDVSIRLAEKNLIGKKGKDNGVLLLVVKDDRKIRIEVGYGLEGALTDAQASSIIRNEITPSFREGRYYEGINKGVDAIIAATKGEYTSDDTGTDGDPATLGCCFGMPIFIVVIFAFIFFFIFMSVIQRIFGIGRSITSGRRSSSPWFWGGGGFGGGSSGWSSGGGFGGFSGGGGSFGGGGASGSW